jgi:hypothetical protein
MKSSKAKYYHVDLDVFEEQGKWRVRLKDPMNQKTVQNDKPDPTPQAAKETASVVAHGYLTNEYPNQQWPVRPINWKDSK